MPDPAFLPQPQRGFLCIGGPMDGQWLSADTAYFRQPQLHVERDERWLVDKVETVDIVYQRTRIRLGGRSVDVFLIKGFDPGDVLVRLLEGYRPHGPQRA